MNITYGEINFYNPTKKYGMIKSHDNKLYFFSAKDLTNCAIILPDMNVTFQPIEGLVDGKLSATKVTKIGE